MSVVNEVRKRLGEDSSDRFHKAANASGGWFTDKGDVIECSFYEHAKVLMNKENISKLPEQVRKEVEEGFARLKRIEKGSQELIDNGEHPEWHHYEMAADDFRRDIAASLYKHNWMRFRNDRGGMTIEATPEALKYHGQFIQQLKDALDIRGMDLNIDRATWVK